MHSWQGMSGDDVADAAASAAPDGADRRCSRHHHFHIVSLTHVARSRWQLEARAGGVPAVFSAKNNDAAGQFTLAPSKGREVAI